ncbi:MAG: extracellular solute-binding protein [Treponema sp.]|jgi:putative aldouronate transport system substrate-binding protein|nr:extracellular solute-binding protein [Treponema sp.]
MNKKRFLFLTLAVLVAGMVFATPRADTSQGTSGGAPYPISFYVPYGSNEHDNNRYARQLIQDINNYANVNLTVTHFALDAYYERLTLLFTSGELPTLIITGNSNEFKLACDNNAFWELTPYIDRRNANGTYMFPNLHMMSDVARNGAGYNGKLYGIPRSRDLTRFGIGYRQDWLERLNMRPPTTVDEFYNMLWAFTYNDPDGNGINDTYGLGVSSYTGVWDIMEMWFGVPNEWDIRNGELIHKWRTPEWLTALDWFRKVVYEDKLINPDWRTYPAGDWDNLLRGGIAGASADVVDRFRRNQTNMETTNPNVRHNIVMGFTYNNLPMRVRPQAGFSDLIAVSKRQVQTEADLLRVLTFLDKLGDAQMLDLIERGYPDVTYYIADDGYYTIMSAAELTAANARDSNILTANWRDGLNQMLPYWNTPAEAAKRLPVRPPTHWAQILEEKVKVDSLPYVVPNYGASYTSPTSVQLGNALTDILNNARLDYIDGTISRTQLLAAIDQWWRAGGEQVTREMNALYRASR